MFAASRQDAKVVKTALGCSIEIIGSWGFTRLKAVSRMDGRSGILGVTASLREIPAECFELLRCAKSVVSRQGAKTPRWEDRATLRVQNIEIIGPWVSRGRKQCHKGWEKWNPWRLCVFA